MTLLLTSSLPFFIQFIISIISLPLAGRYLERIWGPVELIRFSLITIVISNVIAWFLALVLFAVTRGEQQMCVFEATSI